MGAARLRPFFMAIEEMGRSPRFLPWSMKLSPSSSGEPNMIAKIIEVPKTIPAPNPSALGWKIPHIITRNDKKAMASEMKAIILFMGRGVLTAQI